MPLQFIFFRFIGYGQIMSYQVGGWEGNSQFWSAFFSVPNLISVLVTMKICKKFSLLFFSSSYFFSWLSEQDSLFLPKPTLPWKRDLYSELFCACSGETAPLSACAAQKVVTSFQESSLWLVCDICTCCFLKGCVICCKRVLCLIKNSKMSYWTSLKEQRISRIHGI